MEVLGGILEVSGSHLGGLWDVVWNTFEVLVAFSRYMEPYEMYEFHYVFNSFSGVGRHPAGEAFGGILEALGGSWVAFGAVRLAGVGLR